MCESMVACMYVFMYLGTDVLVYLCTLCFCEIIYTVYNVM